MRYVLFLVCLVFSFQSSLAFGQCPDKSEFTLEVKVNSTGENVLEVVFPNSTTDWEWQLVHVSLGQQEATSFAIDNDKILLEGMPDGEYFIKLNNSDGCKVVLGHPTNKFQGVSIGGR